MGEITIEAAGRELRFTSPDKVLFPDRGWTKLDVAEHYLRCSEGAVRNAQQRPCSLKRWPNGVEEDFFFTKRAPGTMRHTVAVRFPSARPGQMAWIEDISDIVSQVQLGVIDINPWASRVADTDHPDELRLDLDPTDEFSFDDCRPVAETVRVVLDEAGLAGWPKTSGSRGLHIYVRIEPRWTFHEVRRAGLAIAREVERRNPLATTAWWKEEREGVFIDYNQNARDKTIASAYSLRQTGRVSTPFRWDELGTIDHMAFDLESFRDRWESVGDLTAGIDEAAGDLGRALEMVEADEANGIGDAPWPPHYPKQPGEPPRVQPSKRKMDG